MRTLVLAALSVLFLEASVLDAHAGRVLFDTAHEERFLHNNSGPLHLSKFADVLLRHGLRLDAADTTLTKELLAGADALVISGPFTSLTDPEIEAVTGFIEGGGRLVVMLHIGSPVAGLLHRLGLDFSNRPIHERQHVIGGDAINFQVTDLDHAPLFTGMSRFSLYGGWAVVNTGENARVIASTSPDAWIDLNGDRKLSPGDAVQAFGVVATGSKGYGKFLVFGDDAIFQNRFLDDDNLMLATNLALWLGGKPQRTPNEDEMLLRSLEAP